MRALERIEKLKQEGRWSFRQPKKQKGPVLAKSHWDWLLDEMVCQEINATGYMLVFTMFDNFDRDGYAPTSGKNANGRSLLRLIWRIR